MFNLRFLALSLALYFSVILIAGCQSKTHKTESRKSTRTHKSGSPMDYSYQEPIPEDPYGFLNEAQQFTFGGKRTGEGYFSVDGSHFVFQSERESDNPFYQIYLTDLKSGKTNRVSPGYGKTTCAWVHPSNKKVLFSSTHNDPKARQYMKEELEFRKTGQKKKYSWDYDDTYDIYEASAEGKILRNLTNVKGYDAEGAYSPDGNWIVFSSNRHAYSGSLTEEEKKALEKDPSLFLDIYIMKHDGTQVKRLTTDYGYDGGPFFSSDGKKIVWRHFEPSGHVAEIYTMNTDGSDKKQITNLKSVSWAPFFHPSGDYIVFTTNKHGYKNFELYLVDALGAKDPVRISYLDDFDGLPVFTPDGEYLTWTRRAQGMSQIYRVKWDDNKARRALGIAPSPLKSHELSHEIKESDIKRTIHYLSSDTLKGRRAGSPEELVYTKNLAELFSDFGLSPGFKNNYIHTFSFPSGAELGKNNKMLSTHEGVKFELGKNWSPLAFSKSGAFANAPVIFAGYGLVVPETEKFSAYDSYANLDVKGKWVVVFRFIPENIESNLRSHFHRYSKLEHKAMIARERGALGLIVVNGPNSKVKKPIIAFNGDKSSGELSIPVLSISDDIAEAWLKSQTKKLKLIQNELDKLSSLEKVSDESLKGFEISGLQVSASVNIRHKQSEGRNVLAMLKVPGAKSTVVIGAHGDHLGEGHSSSSFMNNQDTSQIHYGADDNASGVSGVIELAHFFAKQAQQGKLQIKQNLLFAIWSAEEIGVLGSKAFLDDFKIANKQVYPLLSSYLNMDMIGRYKEGLFIQGVASSSDWANLIEPHLQKTNLKTSLSSDPYVPTDGMPFYLLGVPSITFFTGAHEDYHSPRDRAEKINFEKTEQIVKLIFSITTNVASQSRALPYTKIERANTGNQRGFRIYLGTIPDYSSSGATKGLKLSGVIKGGPAEAAGLKTGDIIIELSGKKIENIHDYVYSLESLKPEQKTRVVVMRKGNKQELEITPQSKQ